MIGGPKSKGRARSFAETAFRAAMTSGEFGPSEESRARNCLTRMVELLSSSGSSSARRSSQAEACFKSASARDKASRAAVGLDDL
jgi:hypothetical protein